MPFDGFFTRALTDEMQTYVGRRVDRIYQPKDDTISLTLGRGTYLVLCINPSAPRFYVTTTPFTNPMTPPSFCMLLRKHLQGGFLAGIEQLENDRIIAFHFTSSNELGYQVKKTLMMEVMGKHSNLILIDTGTHEIHDALKRVNKDMSRIRQLLPGEIYDHSSVMGNKQNPFSSTVLPSHILPRSSKSLWRSIMDTYMGFSPVTARHIALSATLDPAIEVSFLTTTQWAAVDQAFLHFLEPQPVSPLIYHPTSEKKPEDFYYTHLLPLETLATKSYDNLSQVVEVFFATKLDEMRKSQRTQDLTKQIKSLRDRQKTKLDTLTAELDESRLRDTFRLYGDLLSSNLHLLKPHQTEVALPNYYDPEMTLITIPLDPTLSPSANAQYYYKKYQKLRKAESHLIQQLQQTQTKLSYLENALFDLTLVEQDDALEDIKAGLYEAGFIHKRPAKKEQKKKHSSPLTFTSPNGFSVLVGRNSRENDRLTFKLSHKEDLWFHVQDYPGSHVILRTEGGIPQEEDLLFAAQLAAQYSTLKWNTHIAVDYTKRRYVRRMPQGGLGLVHYDHQQTLIIKS